MSSLSTDLISQFSKLVNKKETKRETIVYGTVVESGGSIYVKLDGSNILTPALTTVKMAAGERVTVMIKNHTAVITGNISSPAVGDEEIKYIAIVTDCVNRTDEGIILGDLTNDTILYNVLVSPSSINLQKGSTILAKFTESIIEIGNSGEDLNFYGKSIHNYINGDMYKPYYEAGDEIPITWYGSGFVSNSSASIYFTIPLSKPVVGNPTVTITSDKGIIIRQNSTFTHGSASSTYALPSSYSAELSGDGGIINIIASFSNTTNASNESPCGINASIKIKFEGS